MHLPNILMQDYHMLKTTRTTSRNGTKMKRMPVAKWIAEVEQLSRNMLVMGRRTRLAYRDSKGLSSDIPQIITKIRTTVHLLYDIAPILKCYVTEFTSMLHAPTEEPRSEERL